MSITELADADGHIIEPGDLWVERLPKDLRDMAPRFYRDDEGHFHQRIYGIDIENLDVMYGGIRPSDMLQSMGLACAMGMPLERVFATDDRERFTILDAPSWSMDGRERLAFNTDHKVGRAVLFPTFMLSGGTFLPHVAPAVCQVYNDWILDDYCAGSGGRLIPAAALPVIDIGRRRRRGEARCRARLPGGLRPHQSGEREEVLGPGFRPAVAGDRRHRHEARAAPAPDVGSGRHVEGLPAARHHGGIVPGLSDGHDPHAVRHDVGRRVRPLPHHADHGAGGGRGLDAVDVRALRGAPRDVRQASRRRSGRPRPWRSSAAR